jgi:hypothetical protein
MKDAIHSLDMTQKGVSKTLTIGSTLYQSSDINDERFNYSSSSIV